MNDYNCQAKDLWRNLIFINYHVCLSIFITSSLDVAVAVYIRTFIYGE